jgi:serine/threonine-protein kinase
MSKPAAERSGSAAFATGAVLRKLGKYDIVSELGRGSYGVVYKGFDPFVQREVAVKLAHETAAADTTRTTIRNERDAFLAEARAAGRLNHPYIVQLYDAGAEDGRHFIVMELVEGESLKRFCKRGDHLLSVERILNLALKCALALDYVHKNGVMHKDIKPGNIMLTKDGAPKIMDFGIAAMGGEAVASRIVSGSPMYMSPEQIRGDALGPPSDLYSLGTVMYQLLCGDPPFEAQDSRLLFQQIKTQPPHPLRKMRRDLPDPLYGIVERLLAKNAKERFQTGRELAEELAPLLDHNKRGLKRKQLTINHDSLKQLHFFKAFKSRELGELMDASATVTHKSGDTIIREGDFDNALYIMLAGIAEVRKGKQLVAVMEKGDCFGEIGFLYAVKRTANVVATTDVLVLKVNAALLEQMSEDVQLRYYKIFCENLIIRLTLTTERAAQLLPKSDMALDFILP